MEKMTAQEIEQKRAGEKETVDCMIGIYCRGVHGTKPVYGDEDVLQCL